MNDNINNFESEVQKVFERLENFSKLLFENIESLDGEIASKTIPSFELNTELMINYATGNIVPSISDLESNLHGSVVNLSTITLRDLHNNLQNKFFLDIEEDTYFDLIEIYKLFVLNRNRTIAEVLFFIVTSALDKIMQFTDDEVADKLIEIACDDIDMEEAFDNFYLERRKEFHDKLYFETPRQNFYEAFFRLKGILVEDIKNNDEIKAHLKAMLIRERLNNIKEE